MYDALTADRVYRPAFSAYEAYEMISATGNHFFDIRLVKAFLHYVAAYPAGTLVKLNTGDFPVTENPLPIRVTFCWLKNTRFL